FYGFAVHWILIAAARSFVSGASSAYLYEYLRRNGNKGGFKQIEGNARAYSLFGRVLCFAVIGYLMEWKLTLPYWLTVVSAAVSVAYATSLPVLSEEARKDASELRSSRPSLPSAFTR